MNFSVKITINLCSFYHWYNVIIIIIYPSWITKKKNFYKWIIWRHCYRTFTTVVNRNDRFRHTRTRTVTARLKPRCHRISNIVKRWSQIGNRTRCVHVTSFVTNRYYFIRLAKPFNNSTLDDCKFDQNRQTCGVFASDEYRNFARTYRVCSKYTASRSGLATDSHALWSNVKNETRQLVRWTLWSNHRISLVCSMHTNEIV